MGCWREAFPTVHLRIRFTMCRDNRAEDLCVMQTHGYFTEDSRESRVILWCGLVGGFLEFQVAVRPMAEQAYHVLFCSQ